MLTAVLTVLGVIGFVVAFSALCRYINGSYEDWKGYSETQEHYGEYHR